MVRMSRVAALLTVLALSVVPGRADAAVPKLTVSMSSAGAERGAHSCNPNGCTELLVETPIALPMIGDRHACLGTGLADAAPVYRCSVFVGAAIFGRAVKWGAKVSVTYQVVSDDGAPWSDEVRRTIRGQSAVTQPPTSGAPAPCSLVPVVEPRVSCAKVGPRTWSVSGTTSSKTGVYIMPLQIEFPSSSGTQPVCEYLRLKATAKSVGQTAKFDLGRRKFCA